MQIGNTLSHSSLCCSSQLTLYLVFLAAIVALDLDRRVCSTALKYLDDHRLANSRSLAGPAAIKQNHNGIHLHCCRTVAGSTIIVALPEE